ncbi:MAG: AgmX/PglI C-terminal domain-containing protein [Myxococcota bacterium]
MRVTCLFVVAVSVSASAQAPKRLGLGGRSGGLLGGKADAKAMRFELDLLKAVNDLRKKRTLQPVTMDEALRTLMRQQAEWGAQGNPRAKSLDGRIKAQKLAPNGYRMQYAAGTKVNRMMRDLKKDRGALGMLTEEFARIGIGAYWVPDESPYFQVSIVVAPELDPMAGKPGLTRAQTDPIMKHVAEQIKKYCYNPALEKNPNLKGTLVFQIIVGAGGSVGDVKLLSKTESAILNSCALEQVRVQPFPAPYKDKPVTLNHPMRFSPPQGDERIGKLSPTQITRAFSAARSRFQDCYEARVEAVPGLEGVIELGLTISKDGVIITLEVRSDDIGDPPLQRCVVEQAHAVRFPPPKYGGAAKVIFPVRFAPAR